MKRGPLSPRLITRIAAVATALVLTCAGTTPSAAETNSELEYAVKATFLAKFAPFVNWPAGAFESETSAVLLCLVGDDPVTRLSPSAASEQHDGKRPIVVRHLKDGDARSGCHILYVASSEAQNTAEVLASVKGLPVLTVTDSAHTDAGAAGIISFVMQDNHVRFDIDVSAAGGNGLGISSKLLGLARFVRPPP